MPRNAGHLLFQSDTNLCVRLLPENAEAAISFQSAKLDLVVVLDFKFAKLRSQLFFREHFFSQIVLFETTVLDQL